MPSSRVMTMMSASAVNEVSLRMGSDFQVGGKWTPWRCVIMLGGRLGQLGGWGLAIVVLGGWFALSATTHGVDLRWVVIWDY